ncbi:MAG: hypothetical protein NDJ90_10880, partial [Oligoflexia bacterium]|nr:hypothetical protein [Oligoflexia bacterium]
LAHSFERQSALQQVQAFLEGRGVNPRIIRIGVEATDELLMNALFDAPWSEAGGPYRKYLSRSEGFPLDGRERVTVRMAANEELIGISVTDGFGSLQRAKVLEHLCQDLRFTQYVPPEGNKAGAGLGLHRVNQQAVALLFSSQPGVKTEVTVFLNNSKSFREFRLGFCFFSILSGEA